MPEQYDPYWIRSVTDLGDRRPILTQRDIHADTGARLVARGTSLDSSARERLLQHKLLTGLEHCSRIENAVGPAQLRRAMAELRDADPLLGALFASVGQQLAPLELLLEVPVPNPLAFKLTVAREQRPGLFNHTLVIAVIALYLAVRAGWNRPAVVRAVTAALAHDLGELHLDPEMLRAGHRLDQAERQALHGHPRIAHRLLKETPELHPAIARAVLEHHERLDGSGYPQGLTAAAISPLGRLLAVAEVAASRFDSEGVCHDPQGLATVLRLNSHKLDAGFTGLLAPVALHSAPPDNDTDRSGFESRLYTVSDLFQQWEQATAAQAGREGPQMEAAIVEFITEQVWALRTQLLDAGFNPRDPDTVLALVAEDERFMLEVDDLLDEATWQFDSLAHEVARRWPTVLARLGEACPLLAWLARARETRPPPAMPEEVEERPREAPAAPDPDPGA